MPEKPFKLQKMLSVREVHQQIFPSRTARWVKDQARAGAFGDVVRDAGGWLIPESGVLEYLERNRVKAGDQVQTRSEQRDNLRQFSE